MLCQAGEVTAAHLLFTLLHQTTGLYSRVIVILVIKFSINL